jgi:mitotic spindle assembly checkpoint protein MAD1
VPYTDWVVVCQEKAQLEEEPCQKEKYMLRLRQIFAAQTAESREALALCNPRYQSCILRQWTGAGHVAVRVYDLGVTFIFQPASRDAGQDGNVVAERI